METIQTVSDTPISGSSMKKEILQGLNRTQKSIPSKYFYDERGSRLFESITNLPEYYLTRTENRIIRENIDEIARTLGPSVRLIEPGSGSSFKTRLLLNHLSEVCAYIPVEISSSFLSSTVKQLSEEYPDLDIRPVAEDFSRKFQLPDKGDSECRDVVFFPGSTIGNFTPGRARDFLRMISVLVKESGGLLVGTDLKKDPHILEAAYNDSGGVTAEFNKNLLVRLNRELNANFDIEKFKHRAIYNQERGRIEMHLVSSVRQTVKIGGWKIKFKKGEYIHTENSYKYTLKEFRNLALPFFSVRNVWTDKDNLFAEQYLVPR